VPFHGQIVCVPDGRSSSSRTESRGKYALPSTVTMSSDSAMTVPFQVAVAMPATTTALNRLFRYSKYRRGLSTSICRIWSSPTPRSRSMGRTSSLMCRKFQLGWTCWNAARAAGSGK
jgi:hypothetical protein